MAASFSESLRTYQVIQLAFARRAAAVYGALHETSLKTREVIAQSHDALAEADRILAETQRMLNQNRPS
jgi:hypothetical protein